MGDLIVENGTYVDAITEIDVKGYPNKRQTGLNILSNNESDPISLQQGTYDVDITVKDPNGKITKVNKQVTIPKDGCKLVIKPQPEEPETSVPPNLVKGV
jgi:hypothetical protein